MKKLAAMLTCMCLLSCNTARVLSSDGLHELAYCGSTNIFDCVATKCPNGYDIVTSEDAYTTVVKCRP